MSIFVAGLAFSSEEQVVLAKLSILIASSIAIVLGIIALYIATKGDKNDKDDIVLQEATSDSKTQLDSTH